MKLYYYWKGERIDIPITLIEEEYFIRGFPQIYYDNGRRAFTKDCHDRRKVFNSWDCYEATSTMRLFFNNSYQAYRIKYPMLYKVYPLTNHEDNRDRRR